MNIESLCKKYNIENYIIRDDGRIDVNGDVDLRNKELKKLPLKFGHVSGNFSCSFNQLTSLEGCPTSVGGYFSCSFNQLTSLEGCPTSVGGYFYCNNNQLTSLEGCPKSVGGDFFCSDNQLTSLEGCPKSVGGDFFCDDFSALCEKSSTETLSILLGTDWVLRLFPDDVQGIRMKLIEHAMNL